MNKIQLRENFAPYFKQICKEADEQIFDDDTLKVITVTYKSVLYAINKNNGIINILHHRIDFRSLNLNDICIYSFSLRLLARKGIFPDNLTNELIRLTEVAIKVYSVNKREECKTIKNNILQAQNYLKEQILCDNDSIRYANSYFTCIFENINANINKFAPEYREFDDITKIITAISKEILTVIGNPNGLIRLDKFSELIIFPFDKSRDFEYEKIPKVIRFQRLLSSSLIPFSKTLSKLAKIGAYPPQDINQIKQLVNKAIDAFPFFHLSSNFFLITKNLLGAYDYLGCSLEMVKKVENCLQMRKRLLQSDSDEHESISELEKQISTPFFRTFINDKGLEFFFRKELKVKYILMTFQKAYALHFLERNLEITKKFITDIFSESDGTLKYDIFKFSHKSGKYERINTILSPLVLYSDKLNFVCKKFERFCNFPKSIEYFLYRLRETRDVNFIKKVLCILEERQYLLRRLYKKSYDFYIKLKENEIYKIGKEKLYSELRNRINKSKKDPMVPSSNFEVSLLNINRKIFLNNKREFDSIFYPFISIYHNQKKMMLSIERSIKHLYVQDKTKKVAPSYSKPWENPNLNQQQPMRFPNPEESRSDSSNCRKPNQNQQGQTSLPLVNKVREESTKLGVKKSGKQKINYFNSPDAVIQHFQNRLDELKKLL